MAASEQSAASSTTLLAAAAVVTGLALGRRAAAGKGAGRSPASRAVCSNGFDQPPPPSIMLEHESLQHAAAAPAPAPHQPCT